MSADTRVKLREGAVAWQEVDDETIMLDLRTSTYLGVNPSGTVLWSALVKGTTEDELVDRLATTFDISRERATGDVDAFLADCRARDLLES
jgi:hypothetical protein